MDRKGWRDGRCWFVALLLLTAGRPGCPTPAPGPDENTNVNDNGTDGAPDSDGDGFSDDEEINGIPGTDPFDPTDNPDNVRDTDGDGCSDFDESNFVGFCNNDPNVPGGGGPTPGGSAAVSGRLTISNSSVVDGDTNDPTNAVISNNAEDLSQVQPLPNPCSLGGFLGFIGLDITDVTDVFRVSMAAGQTASLLLANPLANDFDLYLYDEAGTLLDSSEGVGKAEQVTAPANGTFLLEVFGFSIDTDFDPGGLYTLLVGQSALGAAAPTDPQLSSLHPFVEGEVVVRYRSGTARAVRDEVRQTFELEVLNAAEDSGGVERLRVKRRTSMSGRQAPQLKPLDPNRAPVARVAATTVLRRPSSDTIAAVKELRRRADVAFAEPNYRRFALATPNDEFFNFQWHYPQIALPDAWDITTGDPGVIVAVIDTGVVLSHPDLQGQLVAGFDFISDPSISRDGDGIDPNPDDPGDLGIQGTTSTFHGTHVSGTVAARTNNGSGGAGVAWDVKVMPIRVLGQGGGTDFDIVQGIRYAAGLSNNSGTLPAQRADIINMSLGGQGLSSAEQEAITAARAAGVIVIAAAGNEASNANFTSPAGLDGVVTVSAVGFTRALAPYSNFGTSVEVAAPGGDMSVDANGDTFADGVLSTLGQDDGSFVFDFSQGTSMAAPHVAGVAALMKSMNADLTPDDFDQLLAGTHPGTSIAITDDLGPPGKDESFGFGLINALNAVRAAAEIAGVGTIDRPVIKVLPGSLVFGSDSTMASLTVSNTGTDTLGVTSVTASEPWLSVNPTSGGAGTYTVSVDRSGLSDGVFTGSITFGSNGGSAVVSVRMNVGTPQVEGGDVGTLYVLIVDLENLATVGQFNATADDAYVFSFVDVPVGAYGLFAGTDMDNDSFINNEGEALGGYPTLLDSQILDVSQDRTGLVFNVTYQINVQTPTAAGGEASALRPSLPPRLK